VLVDGREAFSKPVGGRAPTRVESEIIVDVKKGSLVDLAATPGPKKDTSYDAFGMSARIFLLDVKETKPAQSEGSK